MIQKENRFRNLSHHYNLPPCTPNRRFFSQSEHSRNASLPFGSIPMVQILTVSTPHQPRHKPNAAEFYQKSDEPLLAPDDFSPNSEKNSYIKILPNRLQ